MGEYVVDKAIPLALTLISGGGGGSTKSDFTTTFRSPITLPTGKWGVTLRSITFDNSIINYAGEDWNRPPLEEERTLVEMEEDGSVIEADDSPTTINSFILEYLLSALDHDGHWFGVGPLNSSSPMNKLTVPLSQYPPDKYTLTLDLNAAFAERKILVTYPRVPVPTEKNLTYLHFFQTPTPSGYPVEKIGTEFPLETLLNRCPNVELFLHLVTIHARLINAELNFSISPTRRLHFMASRGVSFELRNNNIENLQVMARLFGFHPEQSPSGRVTARENDTFLYTSEHPLPTEKPYYDTPLNPMNLDRPPRNDTCGPHWNPENGGEFFVTYLDVNNSRSFRRHYYNTVFNTASKWEFIQSVFANMNEYGLRVTYQEHPDPREIKLSILNTNRENVSVNLYGLPNPFLLWVLGVEDNAKAYYRTIGEIKITMHINIPIRGGMEYIFPETFRYEPPKIEKLSSFVRCYPDPISNGVQFHFLQPQNVQGFTARGRGSLNPFFEDARVTVRSPANRPGFFVWPAGVKAPGHQTWSIESLVPTETRGTLLLQEEFVKPMGPRDGFKLESAMRKTVPLEDPRYEATFASVYVPLHDMTGTLPHPASFKTSKILIEALYATVQNELDSDNYNSRFGLKAKDLLHVTYDPAVKKYYLTCGEKCDYVKLTLSYRTAALFGLEHYNPEDEMDESRQTEVVFMRNGQGAFLGVEELSKEEWKRAREGFPYTKAVQLNPSTPSVVSSFNPVTLSLGTNNIYVWTDLATDSAFLGPKRGSYIGAVPVNWEESGNNLHQPAHQDHVRVSINRIDRIRVQLRDSAERPIKFMSNNNSPVIVVLSLKYFREP